MGSSLLGEHASGMGTVLLHGSANLVELSSVVVGHGLETAVVGSLVRVNEALELGILLKVLLVTLVTDADHAVHLGTHIGVDLSLSELVLVDNTGQLCDASVGLGNLLLHSGAERANADTEVSTGPGDTHGSLLAGVLDTLDVLRETLVVQSLGGVEGRSHARGGSLKSEIGVVTITLHLGANTTELGSGLSHDDLEPVVGPLASGTTLAGELGSELGTTLGSKSLGIVGLLVELGHSSGKSLLGSNGVGLDLGGVLGNGLVGLLDASIDGRGISSRGTLLGEHLDMQCMSSMTLVSGNLGTDLGRFLNVGTVTCVLKSGSLVEPPLSVTHGTHEIVFGLPGIGSHAAEQGSLHLATGSLVESHVAVHLGAHIGNIALAGNTLSSDLLLNIGKVVRQAHAAIRGVCENLASLLHIGGVHRAGAADALHLGPGHTHGACGSSEAEGVVPGRGEHRLSLQSVAISGDVHDRAAQSKATEETERDTRTSHLISRHVF